jgi:hypothetical protein
LFSPTGFGGGMLKLGHFLALHVTLVTLQCQGMS